MTVGIENETVGGAALRKLECHGLIRHGNRIGIGIVFRHEATRPLHIGENGRVVRRIDGGVGHLFARSRLEIVEIARVRELLVLNQRLTEGLRIRIEDIEAAVDRRLHANGARLREVERIDMENGVRVVVRRERHAAEVDATAGKGKFIEIVGLSRPAVVGVNGEERIGAENRIRSTRSRLIAVIARAGRSERRREIFENKRRAREIRRRAKAHGCAVVGRTGAVNREGRAGGTRDRRVNDESILRSRIVFVPNALTLALAVVDLERRTRAERERPRAGQFAYRLLKTGSERNRATRINLQIIGLAEDVARTERNGPPRLHVRRTRVDVGAVSDSDGAARKDDIALAGNARRKCRIGHAFRIKTKALPRIAELQVDFADAVLHVNDIAIRIVVERSVAAAAKHRDKVVGRVATVGILVVVFGSAVEVAVRRETTADLSVGLHGHASKFRNAFEKIEIERTAARKKRCAVVRLIHAVAARRFRAVEGNRRRLVGRKFQRTVAAAARREHELTAVAVDFAEVDRPAAREIKSPNKTIYLAARGKHAL